jgi:hypothetical protein
MPEYVLTEATKPAILRRLSALACRTPWKLVLTPKRDRRSLDQNARLWKLHALAAEATGYDAEEMHEIMLQRHFGVVEKPLGEQVFTLPRRRSSRLDVAEFAAFMEYVEAFYATELGVFLA